MHEKTQNISKEAHKRLLFKKKNENKERQHNTNEFPTKMKKMKKI